MLDAFTRRRFRKFIESFRSQSGQLPTLQDLRSGGFAEETVDIAIKEKVIDMLYITLTNGTVVKGFKVIV